MTFNRSTSDRYAGVAERLIGTAKRHPEALLVIAAGCALLMRSRGSHLEARSTPNNTQNAQSGGDWNISRTTEKAGEVVSDLKERVSDVASTVTDYAGSVGRTISTQTSQIAGQAQATVEAGFGHVLREQPLALVVLGLAAGAAVAMLLPATEFEERTLAPARDAIVGMTGKVGGNLIEAASDAAHQLTQAVAERATEGFKEVVHEVAGKFTDKVAGNTDISGGAPRNISTLPNRRS